MRLRHIPGAEEMIEKSPYVVTQPSERRGSFGTLFGNTNPIEIEVGMGKGKFITELAMQNPDKNFIGIERYSTVLVKAIRKRERLETPLGNLYFMCLDAGNLAEVFAPGEVSRIYLNFSDPWPKERHAGRRLTSPKYMAVSSQILAASGLVEFKTDNRAVFEYSMESIPQAGWNILYSTFDLHQSDLAKGNVMTEYETKFSAEGKPICKLAASRLPVNCI